MASDLEQPPHAVGFGETAGRFDQVGGFAGRLPARQPIGALEQAEPGEENSLRNRAVDRRPRATRGSR